MRRLPVLSTLLAGLVVSAPTTAAPERFVLDPGHVSIGFLVGHARYADVLGMFTDVEGEFVYDAAERQLLSGSVVIDARSVFTGHERRDDHVRDEDFLYTQAHEDIVFEATGYEASSDSAGTLQGEITIRGVTQPLTLDVTLNRRDAHPIGGKDTLGGSARGSLLRSEFGMEYALQGDLVGDEIDLIIEFEAIKADD